MARKRAPKPLTNTQQAVLDRLAAGRTPQEIADERAISVNGVYGHIRKIKAAGHEIPEAPAAQQPGFDDVVPPVTRADKPEAEATNGQVPGDDAELVSMLTGNVIRNAEELVTGLSTRREELNRLIEGNKARIVGIEGENKAIYERLEAIEARLEEAAAIGRAVRPLAEAATA